MGKQVGNVADAINALVGDLGLEKVGADLIADPGTAQPAKQDAGRSQIEGASEGSRSAENTADVKAEVPGEDIDDAKESDANNTGPDSSTENLTTATFVGEDPAVEKDYTSNQPDPGTAHPASVNAKNEKYSAVKYEDEEQFKTAAEDILKEAAELDEAEAVEEDTDGDFQLKTAADARDYLYDHLEGDEAELNEKTAEDRSALVDQETADYVEGFAKSASIVADLTADMLDGMTEELQKQAEGEEMLAEVPPEEMMEGAIPAEALEEGAAMEGAGADEEAMALAEAAQEVAAELGVSPEEVLALAEEELAGGGEGAAPVEDAAAADLAADDEGMEVAASAKELEELRKKAAELDELKAKEAAEKTAAEQKAGIAETVTAAMDGWWERKNAEIAAQG